MGRALILSDLRANWLLICCALAVQAIAQKPVERTYHFEVQGLDDRADEKVVHSVVKDLAPDALVSLSLAIHQVKVRTTATLAPADLETGLAPWGLHLVRWNIPSETELDERRPGVGIPPDFPVLTPTGDPAADETELGRRKERWYAAHPDHPLSPH